MTALPDPYRFAFRCLKVSPGSATPAYLGRIEIGPTGATVERDGGGDNTAQTGRRLDQYFAPIFPEYRVAIASPEPDRHCLLCQSYPCTGSSIG